MQEPLDALVETCEKAILSAIQVRSAHRPARHRDGWGASQDRTLCIVYG